MTPKDKAKKLAMKFDKYGETDNAKKSALIAVDEIIKSKELNYLFSQEQIYCLESTSDDRWINETFIKYWRQVKKEIKKL
jgi:hypothetical protein